MGKAVIHVVRTLTSNHTNERRLCLSTEQDRVGEMEAERSQEREKCGSETGVCLANTDPGRIDELNKARKSCHTFWKRLSLKGDC